MKLLAYCEPIKNYLFENSMPVTESGCWIWMGGVDKDGYGNANILNKKFRAHRLSYEVFKNVNPGEQLVCHKCNTPQCINPDHLYLGFQKENAQDTLKNGKHYNANKTSCPSGHFDYVPIKRGGRMCRICNRERVRRYHANGYYKTEKVRAKKREYAKMRSLREKP